LQSNLRKHNAEVEFYNTKFQNVMNNQHIPVPVGVYFYNGAHDLESQCQAIKLVEPVLADSALVIVDDWRTDVDTLFCAKTGTEHAIAESRNLWKSLYVLPARYSGDRVTW
jgi:hypothetical protein